MKFPEFSRVFQSHTYTFPQVITTKLKVPPCLELDKYVLNYVTDDTSQQNLPSQQFFYTNIRLYQNYFIHYNFP